MCKGLHCLQAERDLRLERSHECLSEMRTVRLLGWEDIAEGLIDKERKKELRWGTWRMYLSGLSYWTSGVAGSIPTQKYNYIYIYY